MKTKRIIDANLNRACEGLRVLEDIARFICNASELTEKIKRERHSLRELFSREVSGSTRLRDVKGDVGRRGTVMEEERTDILAVAIRNAKRVEEALRSLEEVSKFKNGNRSRRINKMRFSVYGFEQELLSMLSRGKGLAGKGIYVVLPDRTEREIMRLVRKLADAPIAAYQLRCKHLPDDRLLSLAKRIRRIANKHSIPFMVNDRVDIALAAGADGVHIGQGDMPLREIRRITEFSFTVGVSTHSLPEALRAEEQGADYIAFGSIFPTTSKEHATIQGIGKLKQVCRRVEIPVVAIGGITDKNAGEVVSAGARFVAVLSYLGDTPDPAKAAQRLDRVLRKGLKKSANRG